MNKGVHVSSGLMWNLLQGHMVESVVIYVISFLENVRKTKKLHVDASKKHEFILIELNFIGRIINEPTKSEQNLSKLIVV